MLIAPHFFVEGVTTASISEMRAKLTRPAICGRDWRAGIPMWMRRSVAGATSGWVDFGNWDITEYLAYIRVPVLIVQGEDDQYGTAKQIEAAQEECYCPVEVTLLPGAKHSPQRDAPEATLNAIAEFVARALQANEWVKAA